MSKNKCYNMIIKKLDDCTYFKALDETLICEFLHPEKEEEYLEMNFSIAHAILKPGKSSLPHRMKSSMEIYYILQGKGLMHIEDETKKVESNQAIYIPPNSTQWIENIDDTDLMFLCLVNPPWKDEDEDLV